MNLGRCGRFAEWPLGTRFSRPGGIYKLAGRKVAGTCKMSRMRWSKSPGVCGMRQAGRPR
jgi:hypothetical protein